LNSKYINQAIQKILNHYIVAKKSSSRKISQQYSFKSSIY